jgi:hypothetical protein
MIHINLKSKASAPKANRAKWTIIAATFLVVLLVGSLSRARELLVDGNTVSSDEFRGVYAIRFGLDHPVTPDGSNETLCTAFLVQPRLLLTAAHCLQGISTINSVTNQTSADDSGSSTVESYRAYPEYVTKGSNDSDEENWKSGSMDIGYVVLRDPVKNADPIEIYSTDSDAARAGLVGQIATFVGYGANRWQQTGNYADAGSGTKRTSDRNITGAEHGLLYLKGPGKGVLPGDSGGPLLMMLDGKLKVVAINHKMSDLSKIEHYKVLFSKKDHTRVVRTAYDGSIESPLTLRNLCWVESESGLEIPGVDCTKLPPKESK